MSHEKFPEPKGRYHRSIFSPLIVFFFKSKFSFLRSRLFKLAGFLEGGDFSSFTIRAILNTYYAIRAEEYNYGFNDLIDNIRIGDPQFITIGRYVSIASRVRIIRRNHPLGHLSTHPFFYDALRHIIKEDHKEKSIPLAIGHDAWIGFNSIILPGCTSVGVGAVIGAGSVVTKDVPNFAIVAGNPAAIIRFRFTGEVQELILKSRWWELPPEECSRRFPEIAEPLNKDRLAPLL